MKRTARTGILYIVATPIGNLQDISLRAIEILRNVDRIAAEDTRHSQQLLNHFNIATRTFSFHAHNEEQRQAEMLNHLLQGLSIALISDAGTPLIHDPGYRLVCAAREQNIQVVPVPGACALITALSAAGLPADRFLFEGFLPAKATARRKRLALLKDKTCTVIFYEAPHRIQACVADMIAELGEERYVVLARELTKTFETIYGGTLSQLETWLTNDPYHCKGEFVVLIRGAVTDSLSSDQAACDAKRILKILLTELSMKQAIALAMKITHEKKNTLYEWALTMSSSDR